MDLSTMQSLFEHELKDLYSAEKQIIEALPGMADAASSRALRGALGEHFIVTEQQFERLRGVMRQLNIDPDGAVCKGMQGLLEEGKQIIEAKGEPAVKDAALIGAAQRVEHYEIAAYGTVREFARDLGYDDVVRSLDMTLHEEGDADKELSRIARGTRFEAGINAAALNGG
jgi:ferritin-like metal-binding protein YciE